MKKIISWIIDQGHETIDTYQSLVLPMSEELDIEISCAQSIIDTVIVWETDSNTIDSLDELLIKRFPDFKTK
jgi:hypothetical protein